VGRLPLCGRGCERIAVKDAGSLRIFSNRVNNKPSRGNWLSNGLVIRPRRSLVLWSSMNAFATSEFFSGRSNGSAAMTHYPNLERYWYSIAVAGALAFIGAIIAWPLLH
jgi:hypothetical protein